MPPRNRRVERTSSGNWVITGGATLSEDNFQRETLGNVTAVSDSQPRGMPSLPNRVIFWEDQDPFSLQERPQDNFESLTIEQMERMLRDSSRRRVPPLPDSAPQVNIKRHLSKSERDSRHKPAKDVKKIVSISLDDLVSI